MAGIVESRQRQQTITEVQAFIKEAEETFNSFLWDVGLKKESLFSKVPSLSVCPFNPGHSVPTGSLTRHMKTCSITSKGYTLEEIKKAVPSSNFCYAESTVVIPLLIDKSLQSQILLEASRKDPLATSASGPRGIRNPSELEKLEVPLTVNRCVADLSEAERLAIYDYCVQKGNAMNKSNNLNMDDLCVSFEKSNNESDKPKTELQLLAEQRDYKRRRQSYRAKNVHITKKSYTEVMREVIENQCQYLKDISKPDIKEETYEHLNRGTEPTRHEDFGRDRVRNREPSPPQNRHRHHKHKSHHKSSHHRSSRHRDDTDKESKSNSRKRRRSNSREHRHRRSSKSRD